jgi:hypothetical protein
MNSERLRPRDLPDALHVGGTSPGPLSVRWGKSAGTWLVRPSTELSFAVREDYGILGVVTSHGYNCSGYIFSRQGRSRRFTAPASNEAEACQALVDQIADIFFNPMLVPLVDDLLGPCDDLSPLPSSVARLDPFALQWGDRLGGAINMAAHGTSTPDALRSLRRCVEQWDAARRHIAPATIEGARVRTLMDVAHVVMRLGPGVLHGMSDTPECRRAAALRVMAKVALAMH